MERDRIYIAGKITGDPYYREKFAKAEKRLKERGYTVMNPAILPDGFEYEDYIKISLTMLAACKFVYFLKDWKESMGALGEHEVAVLKGKTIFFE